LQTAQRQVMGVDRYHAPGFYTPVGPGLQTPMAAWGGIPGQFLTDPAMAYYESFVDGRVSAAFGGYPGYPGPDGFVPPRVKPDPLKAGLTASMGDYGQYLCDRFVDPNVAREEDLKLRVQAIQEVEEAKRSDETAKLDQMKKVLQSKFMVDQDPQFDLPEPSVKPPGLDLSSYPKDTLEVYLQSLFKIADENNDGVLSEAELKKLLMMSGFQFSEDQVDEMMKEADSNQDGVIDYLEYIPAIVGLCEKYKFQLDY